MAAALACLLVVEGTAAATHVWEKVEIELSAANTYTNSYADVDVWVQLEGPGFSKRCHGFWDGGNVWRVRVMATAPGTWTWTSGSDQADAGINGQTGSFEALAWTDAEKQENPLRRGMIQPTANGHAFQYADGTSFFWLADTWWSCMTRRFSWYDDEIERPVGTASAGFKDYVRFRKAQGYNGCNVIAAFPNWTDTSSGWGGPGWTDEAGNRAFFGGGTTPDLNHLNPAYFQSMDKKVDYLNAQGFIPCVEPARRDIAAYWKSNFGLLNSYARYIRYICFRYQANMVINSPIHLDAATLTKAEWNAAGNIIVDQYEWPPFGQATTANPPRSTLDAFGHTDEARWLTVHSVGNTPRNHLLFPDLTRIFDHAAPVPCLNHEPYYDGLKFGDTANLGSDQATYYCRVGIYGSLLSGALMGHAYGADHIWDGDSEMPGAFLMPSAPQMWHARAFLLSEGDAYRDLIPSKQLLLPNQTANSDNNKGWAYCLRTGSAELFLLYFEQGCARATLSGCLPARDYVLSWFKPDTGQWVSAMTLTAGANGRIVLPDFPSGITPSTADWAAKLVATSPQDNQVVAPLFNPPAGSFSSATQVGLASSTPGAQVRYTVDGSTPSATRGFDYSTPVDITANTTLKAYAFKSGSTDSPVCSGSYIIRPNKLSNGSFEMDFTSWTPTGNIVFVSEPPYVATNQAKLVVFNGDQSPADGVLSQGFTTMAGQVYTLAFDAGVFAYNTNPQTLQINVTGASSLLSQTVTINGVGGGALRWVPQTFNFIANSASTTLTFRDQSTTTNSIDLMLDHVRVLGPAATVLPAGSLVTPSLSGTPGDFTITMTAPQAGSYFLERSAELKTWQYVSETLCVPGEVMEFHDPPNPPAAEEPATSMFYRIRLEAAP